MPEEVLQIKGLSRFRSSLKKAGAEMADMKEANIKVANIVTTRAKGIGPQRTGRLVGSVVPAKTVARARVRSNLIYAPVIHYGWPKHHIAAQPFVTEAATQTQPEWLATYNTDLQKLLDSVQGA